ncbi:MAG: phosphate acyltransferase PlsX [Gemmatimonadaceae bacterium]|nr:phosphate acyltransferase PlsX [Gemmatimonadaceae bacterium]
MARIALDAMGGDFAPHAPVGGALLALADLAPEHRIQLIGRAAEVSAALDAALAGEYAACAPHRARIEIIDAPEVIGMADKPTAVLRRPDSSMAVGLQRHADGLADAFVSAGNTGAQMAASVKLLKLHGELKRPAIGTIFPTELHTLVVLDSGANVDCSPEELVHFARLGLVYAEDILGRENPAVGLLSIGEEPEKGNAAVKEANKLIAASGMHFVGNVEGRDVAAGRCDHGPFDVVVCDGFTGNVILKFYEGLAPILISMTARAAGADPKELLKGLAHLDYSNYGGAPLLGVQGVSIIAHGKSSPRAIKNAVKVAVRAVESRMSEHIGRRLAVAASAA